MKRTIGERGNLFRAASTKRMRGGCQKSVKEFGGEMEKEKRKEIMVVKKKNQTCRREGEGRQAVSAAVLFFKSCQHIYNVLSIPLLIYWDMHTKKKESNRTEAAEDSLRHRIEVP